MPVFDCVAGGQVYIPAGRIFHAESAPGGLTTNLVFPAPNKANQVAVVEVAHTAKAVGEAIIEELSKVMG